MLYHIEVNDGVIKFDCNETDKRSVKKYFEDKKEAKPKPVTVKGYPFINMYRTHGGEENGQFIAVKAPS